MVVDPFIMTTPLLLKILLRIEMTTCGCDPRQTPMPNAVVILTSCNIFPTLALRYRDIYNYRNYNQPRSSINMIYRAAFAFTVAAIILMIANIASAATCTRG